MPKKETSNKTREWERERRERLNESFNLLNTLLPSYDPSVSKSKIEILQNATAYISDIQKENRELVKSGKDQTWKQVRQLKHRIESLLRRVHQLARLLSDAGISIPPELPKDGHQPPSGRQPKWSNKFRQEDAAVLLEKVKNKRTEKKKKKQKSPLNISGNKVNSSEKGTENIESSISNTSRTNTTLTTSRTKLSRVAKNKKTSKQDDKKRAFGGKDVRCEKLPTVTQLLGLSLNDIDVAPPPPLPARGSDSTSNNFARLTSNTPGTNVTVLGSNVPQVPQGFIVIPRASSIPTTSTNNLPQPPCIVVAPASQASPNGQQTQHSSIVMPSRTQATKVVKTTTVVQQPVPVILSNTTNALETTAAHPVRKSNSVVAVTNSHLLSTPIMATGIQTCPTPALLPSQGTNLTGLGPGTLILANGSILPILPPPQAASVSSGVIAPRNNAQIVVNSGSNMPATVIPNQPVILVQNKVQSTSQVFGTSNAKPRRIYSLCLPKPLKRKGFDSTRTTFVNKLPISALTPRSTLIRSATSKVQPSHNLVNKTSSKSEDTKNNKRVCDRKNVCVNKGTVRNSRNNGRINGKKSSVTNVTKKEMQSTVNSYDNVEISREPEVSKPSSVISTSKENSIVVAPNCNNTIDIPMSGSESLEILKNISSEKQKFDRAHELTEVDACNKRKRDDNEDINTKSNKQTKYESVNDKCNSGNVNDLPTVCQQSCTTALTVNVQNSHIASVDENLKSTNVDSCKILGGIDTYSVMSLCKSNEKNILVSDVNHEDINSSFGEVSQKSSSDKVCITSKVKEVKQDRTINNSKPDDLCNSQEKFSTSSPCDNITPNVNNLTYIERNSEYERSFLNPESDLVVSASSLSSVQNCVKSAASHHVEKLMENDKKFCPTATSSGNKNTTELKTVSCANKGSCDIVDANGTNTDQNVETSSNTNDSLQHDACKEKDISLTIYSHSETADVQIFTSKQLENSTSRDNTSCVRPLQENFGSECITKIQDIITEHKIHDEHSLVSDKINGRNEESTSSLSGSSDTNNMTVKDTQEIVVGDSNDINKNVKDMQETLKNDISGKNNLSSEASSATDYNSYVSVSENNTSLCSAANKLYRNTESLDSSTSTNSSLCLTLQNNELSNDLFASLQVPSGGQHSESISPTAAFLLAFPLVSTSKVSDIIGDSQDDVESDSLQGTSTLLQIGSLDSDQQSEAIISRSSTFHNSNSTTKISSQPIPCQKDSSSCRTSAQDLGCQHFVSSEPSHKVDHNSERMKAESSLKFSEAQDGLQKSEKNNKSWISVHSSPHPETSCITNTEGKDQGKLNVQSYPTKCTMTQLPTRDTTEDCTKAKALDHICTFNVSKEVSGVEVSANNIISQHSHSTNSNIQHFTVSQFVSPAYVSKEQNTVSTKRDLSSQPATLPLAAGRNADFSVQTSNKNENSVFLPGYKGNSGLHTSDTGISVSENVSFAVRKSGIEQGTMTDEVRFSTQSVPVGTSNKTKHSSTLPYNPNDCSDYPITSQCGYALTQSIENEKCNVPSFSVAHNSSNFSILSWTTLSPVSTMTNTSHCDGFNVQNMQPITSSQNNYTSVSKKQNNENCLSEAGSVIPPTTSGVSEICHSNLKQFEPVTTVVSHTVNKITESFTDPVLQNNNNTALQNQTPLNLYFNDQRRIQTSLAQTNVNNATPQGIQSFTGEKIPSNEQQHRPPVNWMTAPDVRAGQQSVLPPSSVRDKTLTSNSSTVPSVSVETGTCKDIEFCTVGSNQNLYASCVSTTLPTYDSRTYTSNSFYGCHSVSSQNSQNNFYPSHTQSRQVLPGVTNENHNNRLHLSSHLNRITDVHVGQHDANDTYSLPWMQRKSCASSVCTTEINNTNFVSSSLPTLVGDLALGTNFPLSVSDDLHGNKGLQSINFNMNSDEKKRSVCEPGNNTSEGVQGKQTHNSTKNSIHNKDQNNVRNTVQEFRTSQSSGGSFLSVSQLVDQAQSCIGSSRAQTVSRHSSSGSRHITMPNKQTACQSRSHELSDLSSASEEPKRGISSLSGTNKEVNHKGHQEIGQPLNTINFRTSESGVVLTRSSGEENRKIESNQVIGNSNNYIPSLTSSSTSVSHGNLIFSVSFNAQSTTSINSNNITWPTSVDVAKQHNAKTVLSTCKAPASSYSAEALIGLNSQHITNHGTGAVQESRGNKVISLPPPVVSERFCHHQNYPSSSVTRTPQVPPPFTAETILSSNYFTPAELQTPSQDTGSTGHRQTSSTHQNNLTTHSHQSEQVFNNSFTSSASPSVGTAAGQCNSVLYTHSDFISSVATAHSNHSLPPVSLPCNFLPDLGTNNSYTAGILSDSGNPFIFPTATIPVTRGSSNCHNSGNVKQNLSHLPTSSHSESTSAINNVRHDESNQVVPALPLINKDTCPSDATLRCNNGNNVARRTGTSDSNSLHQNTIIGGSNCNTSKQRIRKRPSDSVAPSNSSSISGLMDLGYLGMPPVIGSPMLPDDGTFINHSGTFLSSGTQHAGPSLYSGAPTPSQGSFYPTPHSHGQASTPLSMPHSNHLTISSGNFTTQSTRGLQLSTIVSPSTVNSSGTSLTNFNLSTIFPEINEKHVPNHTYSSSGPKEMGSLLSSSLPIPPLPTSAPPPTHPQSANSSSSHTRQTAALLLPPVSNYVHRQASGDSAIRLPPPPPVPLHSSVNFLSSPASQMCRMQWR